MNGTAEWKATPDAFATCALKTNAENLPGCPTHTHRVCTREACIRDAARTPAVAGRPLPAGLSLRVRNWTGHRQARA